GEGRGGGALDANPKDPLPSPPPEYRGRGQEASATTSPTSNPTTAPTTTASTQPAAPPRVPKVVDGFYLTCFVQAPDIHSPCSIAVTPDGKLFVGEDEYNSGPDRKMGISHIKLC